MDIAVYLRIALAAYVLSSSLVPRRLEYLHLLSRLPGFTARMHRNFCAAVAGAPSWLHEHSGKTTSCFDSGDGSGT